MERRILTSSYGLQVNRASFNQNQISPVCLLCKDDDETAEHFLLQCSSLDRIKQRILADILHTCENLDIQVSQDLQLIMDSTAVLLAASNPELKPEDYHQLEKQTRRMCHALQIERYKKVPQGQGMTKRRPCHDRESTLGSGSNDSSPEVTNHYPEMTECGCNLNYGFIPRPMDKSIIISYQFYMNLFIIFEICL